MELDKSISLSEQKQKQKQMHLYAIIVYNEKTKKPIQSCFQLNHLYFWQRSDAKQIIMFLCNELILKTKPTEKTMIPKDDFYIYLYQDVVVIAREETVRNDYEIFHEIIFRARNVSSTEEDLLKLLTFESSLFRTRLIIDETKEIVIRNLDELIERGEKLDQLVEQSADLSASAKEFLKGSQDLRSCSCNVQ